MKIAVIGYSGSGKSTLTKKLGQLYDCPYLYLDTINFQTGWKERDKEEAVALVEAFMENESWIIDGNYGYLCHGRRMSEADKIIFMNFPRHICFIQVFKRYLGSRCQTRESMAEGCEEKFDFDFMKWILKDGRSKKMRDGYKATHLKYAHKFIVCKNRKQVEHLLEMLSIEVECR